MADLDKNTPGTDEVEANEPKKNESKQGSFVAEAMVL